MASKVEKSVKKVILLGDGLVFKISKKSLL
jgi:hypothetical protein